MGLKTEDYMNPAPIPADARPLRRSVDFSVLARFSLASAGKFCYHIACNIMRNCALKKEGNH